jgi:tetratricopeptide (TPR) repeat protein
MGAVRRPHHPIFKTRSDARSMTGATLPPRRRLRTPRASIVIGVALVVVTASYVFAQLLPAPASRSSALTTSAPTPLVPAPDGPTGVAGNSMARLEQAIGVWSANLARDKADFISATNLADLYYARARLTGNIDDFARATEAVNRALAVYPAGLGAQQLRGQLLFATHDFAGALHAAQTILRDHPDQLAALATQGDAQLELGRYDEAAQTFALLEKRAPGPAVTARLAHLASLRGDPAGASRLAKRALAESRAAGASPADRSWYEYLAGYLAFQSGDLAAAQAQFQATVADWPQSYLALAGLARTRAAEGATDQAIGLYQRAIAIVPQPEFAAALGDLYALTGQAELATEQYDLVRAVARLASVQAQVYNRQLVLFDVNHGEHRIDALKMAERELKVRKDVYGWDAYAWALYANGRYAEAQQAMTHARAQRTVDPLLDYHAGMIAAALGRPAEARRLLSLALERNPGFDPLQAARAKDLLAQGSSR